MQYSDGHRPWACDHHSTEENVFHTVDLFSLVLFFVFLTRYLCSSTFLIMHMSVWMPSKIISLNATVVPCVWNECSKFFVSLQLLVSHRVVILQTIELVADYRTEDISSPRIKSIISLASDEMTRTKVKNKLIIIIIGFYIWCVSRQRWSMTFFSTLGGYPWLAASSQ